jgi:putative addiction module component (TIGR02574 family)
MARRDAAGWRGNLSELAVETPMNPASIFDLSPSEKLQLVEDLWGDLVAVPGAELVHDWQKQELARRKAKLAKNRSSARASRKEIEFANSAFYTGNLASTPSCPA